jgi:hypothetical protein
VFTLRAAQYPVTIPVSMASLHLIQQSSSSVFSYVTSLVTSTGSLADKLASLRKLYEADKVPNKVVDGKEPYPENTQSLRSGIEVEFRCVVSCM